MNESQQILARDITERQLSDSIVSLARALGWLVHRDPTWRSTGTDPGYPDLTLANESGEVIWAELKSSSGRLSSAQQRWREALAPRTADGTSYHVWTPIQWFDGTIENVLRGITEQRYEAHAHGDLVHEHHLRGEHDHR